MSILKFVHNYLTAYSGDTFQYVPERKKLYTPEMHEKMLFRARNGHVVDKNKFYDAMSQYFVTHKSNVAKEKRN